MGPVRGLWFRSCTFLSALLLALGFAFSWKLALAHLHADGLARYCGTSTAFEAMNRAVHPCVWSRIGPLTAVLLGYPWLSAAFLQPGWLRASRTDTGLRSDC